MSGDPSKPGVAFAPTLHACFERTVARFPASTAVVADDLALDYRELDLRSTRLARHLRKLGVTCDTIVGIHLERSIPLIVAVIGVLKAGGAWLPLATDQPPPRLAYFLHDAKARVLVTTTALAAGLPAHDAQVVDVDVDRDAAAIAAEPSEALAATSRTDDLAYCIYTSGSTGTPKGVAVQHSGIAALAAAQAAWFGVGPADRVYQFASFGFDAFVFDLVMAFAHGATLVLRRSEPGDALVAEMRAAGVTIATLPPSLLAAVDLASVATLRCVVSAGEACQARHARTVAKTCLFFNAYGPTESTIWASCHRRIGTEADELPIGVPVAGIALHLLDDALQPVPPGVDGEICLAGDALARGYLHRPDLTAERFVPNPHGAPGSRLYRTGDLGYRRDDGAVVFTGRIDRQVKIRGFRIEPGEIERALLGIDGVRDAAVIAHDSQGDARLAAYVVVAPPLRTAGLHAQLARVLPDYMLPAAYRLLDALPLNASGKIDRRALPPPRWERGDDTPYVAPRTPTERRLADLWADVLGVEHIGVEDGFRRLGGSSIQAVTIAFRIGRDAPLLQRVPLLAGNATIAEYAEMLDAALLDATLATEAVADDDGKATIDADVVSSAIEQVCFLEQLGDAWRAYRCHARLDFTGVLDVDALRASIARLVARHEILRTGFAMRDGRLVRQVADHVATDLPLVDLSGLAPDEATRQFDALVALELEHRFDLAAPPLVRWRLVRLARDRHVLLQSEHHNVHDGQSFRLLLRDLAAFYAEERSGTTALLPPVEAHYGAYCAEECRWLASGDFAAQLDRWTARLAPFAGTPRLFRDHAAHAPRRFIGAQRRRVLDAARLAAVDATAARLCVSRYALMLAAFGAVLARRTRQRRLIVGSGLANRTSARFDATAGMFVNTVPVPIDIEPVDADPAVTFAALARAVANDVDFALAHSGVPLHAINGRLASTARPKGEAPFDVAFSFHDTLPASARFDDLDVAIAEALPNGSAKFDLNVVGIVGNASAPLELVFEYDLDALDADTTDDIASNLVTLLDAVVADPHAPVARLPLLRDDERRRLILDGNDKATPFPHDRCIHEIFQAQAQRTPHAIALECGAQRLTYAELDAQSRRLAAVLRTLGAGPDVLVAVCIDRSPALIVALLAILEAGAAYLPLDPELPVARLALMLEETAAPVVVLHSAFDTMLPAGNAHRVHVDAELPAVEPTAAIRRAQPRNLACCLYTSGSTGGPKAVAVEHRNVVKLVCHVDYVQIGADDAMLHAAPLAFDASTFEIWGALLNGARLVLVEPRRPTFDDLARTIAQHGITTLWLTATLFEQFTATHSDALRGVRQLLAGGDVLSVAAVRRVLARWPECRIVNGYGPTETTTFAACHAFPVAFADERAPIGRPIANTTIHLLDDEMNPVPVGVPGEIYIGGCGVARGYFGRPDLTATAFVPDPFGPPGGRLYRSGDLGRRRRDGTIEFLGRIDRQVKLRGFRIEPGEIERVLAGVGGVRDAVVGVRGDGADKHLVAWIAGDATQDAVRAALRECLPDYMIPALLVRLDALPLTANGKVDRARLPEPVATVDEAAPGTQPAATAVEEAVIALMRNIAADVPLSPEMDFFDAGFHSLQLMRLVAKCSARFGVELRMSDAFDAPTPRGFAGVIERRVAAQAGA